MVSTITPDITHHLIFSLKKHCISKKKDNNVILYNVILQCLYYNYNKRQEREKFIAAINQEMIINTQTSRIQTLH